MSSSKAFTTISCIWPFLVLMVLKPIEYEALQDYYITQLSFTGKNYGEPYATSASQGNYRSVEVFMIYNHTIEEFVKSEVVSMTHVGTYQG